MKSDYQYSVTIVYNNFPWPNPTPAQRAKVEEKAAAALAARAQFMEPLECGDSSPLSLRDLSRDSNAVKPAAKSGDKSPHSKESAHSKASTLADLYDPLTMPAVLAKAHAELDKAVEKCYRPEAFQSDRERVEHLFHLYEQLTAPLFAAEIAARPKSRALKKRV